MRILVEETAEPVASSDADILVGDRGVGPAVGWSLAEGPVRPVGVVVIDVFAEDVVEMAPAGDGDAIGALTPDAGDPALTDGVRARCLDRRLDNSHASRGEDCVKAVGVPGIPVPGELPVRPTHRWRTGQDLATRERDDVYPNVVIARGSPAPMGSTSSILRVVPGAYFHPETAFKKPGIYLG